MRCGAQPQWGVAHINTCRIFQLFCSQVSDTYGCVYGPGKEQKRK